MKKYEKIINDIILKIQTGIFKEGEQLYTEKEIKEIYNVSSTTAVRVLNELESAGYIFRVQGKGSFVNKTLVNKKVLVTENNNFHKHFKESVSEHSEVVEAEIIQDKELCAKLKLKNQKLLKVARIKYIGNIAWAYQTNYIPIKYLPDVNINDIDSFKELATMIRKKYRIDIHQEKSKKIMSVIVDTPEEIAKYIAKDGEPCFEFDRYTYFGDGKIFEYVKIYINYKYYMKNKEKILDQLKGGIIVSCQALPGEPLYVEEGGIMKLMALAAKEAGAVGIRAQGITDIVQIKETVDLPVIGIIKQSYEGMSQFITATMKEVDDLVETGCEIIALDCTLRPRFDGTTINDFVAEIKAKYPDIILMADIATFEEGVNAEKIGVDFVGTTLSGYTENTKDRPNEVDLGLIKKLSETISVPIIAEGRIHYPDQAKAAYDAGAFSVVVGGAITRPKEIAARFINAVK